MSPIVVSGPNTDVRTASGKDITLNTQYPFAKLDSTKAASFQLINLLFTHEPPNPSGGATYTHTLVYQFAHGYNYTPKSWFEVSTNDMVSVYGTEGAYLVVGGISPLQSSAVFIATVDQTNVNFYIDKYYTGGIAAPVVLGTVLTIRAYVFVNDMSGLDVPSQP